MQGSPTDFPRGLPTSDDWLQSVTGDEALSVSSTYPATQGFSGKTRLANLRGYPVRRPLERPTTASTVSASLSDESRRPTLGASVSTHADHATLSLQAFLLRLRGYHTFQPLFTNNPAYPVLLEGARATNDASSALAYVDRMLGVSENRLLGRHGNDDNFSRMVDSFVSPRTAAATRGGGAASYITSPMEPSMALSGAPRAASRPLAVVDIAAASPALGGGNSSNGPAAAANAADGLVVVATASELQHAFHSHQRNSDAALATGWEPTRGTASTAAPTAIITANNAMSAAAKLLDQQQRVWEDTELERHRAQRARYLENLHLEIEVLEKHALTAPRVTALPALRSQEGGRSSRCDATVTEASEASHTARERADQLDAQRAAWLAFQSSEGGEPSAERSHSGQAPGPTSRKAKTATFAVGSGESYVGGNTSYAPTTMTTAPSQAVSGYDVSVAPVSRYARSLVALPAMPKDDEVHNWLYGNWSHRTHRHENAAFIIQRAYRVFVAKRCAYRRACARELAFQEALRAETMVRWRWLHAERCTDQPEDAAGEAAAAHARAVRFVVDRLTARATLRRRARARTQVTEVELRQYAATTIQRVFRGHLARIEAHCLRSPRFRQARAALRLDYHAAIIQRRWRLCRQGLLDNRQRRSAIAIQRWYRGCVARRQLNTLRLEKCAAQDMRLAQYAVAVLERFFSRCLTRKHALYRAHKPHIDLLQRCGRGCLARTGVMRHERDERFKAVAAVIETQRLRGLRVRRAKAEAESRRVARRAQYTEWIRTDAAITIQRAWRSRRSLSIVPPPPHLGTLDEL